MLQVKARIVLASLFFSLILFCSCFSVRAAGSDTAYGDKWAVVVGVCNASDPTITQQYASIDARDFAEFLTKSGHFAPDHIKLLQDDKATRAEIVNAIGGKWLPGKAHANDLVVVFVAGTVTPAEYDVSGQNYLMACDSKLDSLCATAIPFTQFIEMLQTQVQAKDVLLVLDTSHSGAAIAESRGRPSDTKDITSDVDQKVSVLCASSRTQNALQKRDGNESVFCGALLEALKSKGEKGDLKDVFAALKDAVQIEVLRSRGVMQTPVMKLARPDQPLYILSVPAKKP